MCRLVIVFDLPNSVFSAVPIMYLALVSAFISSYFELYFKGDLGLVLFLVGFDVVFNSRE